MTINLTAMLPVANDYPWPPVTHPDRRPVAHVAFGHGAHFCVGAALARLEMNVTMPHLAQRYPELGPAWDSEGPLYQPAVVMKTVKRIPVTLGARVAA